MKMTAEILDIINAVVDYRQFIWSNNGVVSKDNFDWYKETEEYFKTLPLPDGMKHNRITFENILSYATNKQMQEKLHILNGTEEKILCEYEF